MSLIAFVLKNKTKKETLFGSIEPNSDVDQKMIENAYLLRFWKY